MRAALFTVALAMTPIIAMAQTTTCSKDAVGNVVCQTRESKERSCLGSKVSALAAGCTLGEIAKVRADDENRKAVGEMIASGRCPDARNYALRAGDLDLAERVDRLCAPSPK